MRRLIPVRQFSLNLFRLQIVGQEVDHYKIAQTILPPDLHHHLEMRWKAKPLESWRETKKKKVFDRNEALKTFIKLNDIKMGTSEPLFVILDIQKFNLNFRRAVSFKFPLKQHVLSSIRSHPTFKAAMDHLTNNCGLLDSESLVKTFANLSRIEAYNTKWEPVIKELVRRKSELSLVLLTQVIVNLKYRCPENLEALDELIAELSLHIEKMESIQDVWHTSNALYSILKIVPPSIMQDYVKKLDNLYETKPAVFTSSPLLEILHCLLSYQSQLNPRDALWNDVNPAVEKYEKLLIPNISQLSVHQLTFLIGQVKNHKNGKELHDFLSRELLLRVRGNLTIDLLRFITPQVKCENALLVRSFLCEMIASDELEIFSCKILQEVKDFPELILADKYWERIVRLIGDDYSDSSLSGEQQKTLLNFTAMYLDWIETTNDKHEQFEKVMGRKIHQLVKDYECGKIKLSPCGYTKFIAFLIATNHPEVIFNPSLCKHGNVKIFERMMRQALKINYIRSKNIINLSHLKNLARIYTCFQTSEQELGVYFDATMNVDWGNDWKFLDDLLNLIMKTRYYHPRAFEKMSKFICDNHEESEVHLEVLMKFMRAAYCIGADMEKVQKAIDLCVSIIEKHFLLKIRNGENFYTVPELEALLSMNFYGHRMEEEIIDAVFRVTSQVDSHVQDLLIQLNRAICIDQPYFKVPWMYQEYCEEKVAEKSNVWDVHKMEIVALMRESVGSPLGVLTDPCPPFGYHVDLLLFLDDNNNRQPIKLVCNSPGKNFVKRAVLIEEEPYYTRGKKQLKGHHQLKVRHLKNLGYKVLYIDLSLWKSLKNKEEKLDYLSGKDPASPLKLVKNCALISFMSILTFIICNFVIPYYIL